MDVEVILHDSGELLPILLDGDGMVIPPKNNVIECNHGKLKRIIRATLGFKSMKTAMPHASIQMALNTDDVQTK